MVGKVRASLCPVRILRWVPVVSLWLCASTTAQASTDGGVYAFAPVRAETLADATAERQRVHAPVEARSARSAHVRPAPTSSGRDEAGRGFLPLGATAAFALAAPFLWRRRSRRDSSATGASRL